MPISSPLATLFMWSPNHYNGRKYPITKITIHHMAGKLSAKTCGNIFLPSSRKASSTYGIGYDGEIAQYVDEADAPWTSSNYDNDNRAITIEVSNSSVGGDWPVSDHVLERLIQLCVDIVKRNPGITEIDYTGDKTGNLTMHKWFASTACPGPYLGSKFPYITEEVNKRLKAEETPGETTPEPTPEAPEQPQATVLYRVQVGAYSKLSNAQAQRDKVKSAGFQTYLVQTNGGLYKVQTGAFSKKANAEAQAEKLKALGFSTYVTTKSGTPVDETPEETPKEVTLTEGDKVHMAKDAPVYGKTNKFQSWVYDATLYVRDVDGDRIVVSTKKTGPITGAVHKKYLTKV